MRASKDVAVGAAVFLNLVAIAYLTLRPAAGSVGSLASTCVLCGERGSADLVLNILLFAPLGAALGLRGWRPVLIAGIGLLFSAAIELGQVVIPGRDPTWRDLIMNGIGAGLGALVIQQAGALVRSRAARSLAWVAAFGALGIVAATGWLLAPQVKRNTWYGQVAPRLPHLEPWEGQVESVRVDGIEVEHGYLAASAKLQQAIADRTPLVIQGTTGPAPSDLAAIFAISDEEFEEMLLVGQQGSGLVVRERRRASTFRLFEPEVRFPSAVAGLGQGAPFSLTVELSRTAACVAVNDKSRTCAPSFAASSAWTLLIWRRWFNAKWRLLLGSATLATLLVPAGFFASGLRPRERGTLAAVLLAGLMVVPQGVGLAPLIPAEWLGVALGLGIGFASGQWVRGRALDWSTDS